MNILRHVWVLGLLSFGIDGGCKSPEGTPPLTCDGGPGCSGGHDGPGGSGPRMADDIFDEHQQKDLDVLFMIDNSPSMTGKQKALAQNIPRFIKRLDDNGVSYHIGITTSDVGTEVAPGEGGLPDQCATFAGDDGTLQRQPCNDHLGISSGARDACASLCPDPSFVPQGGQGFISKVNGTTNVPVKMSGGKDIGPQLAFQCLALVGDGGCGIEGQLEGAKRALDGHNPDNMGFLRPGSVLAVILITDEDDCSVSPAGRKENVLDTMDCPTPDKNAGATCFNPDYRCLARDLECDEPTNTPGEKHNCHERPASYLEPVATYVRFFQALRPPDRLLIRGIWAPPIDGTLKINKAPNDTGHFKAVYLGGGTRTANLNRGIQTEAACYYATDPTLFARPQLRLSKFAAQFPDTAEVSICDIDSYPPALDDITRAIIGKFDTHCTSLVPAVGLDGKPECKVGDLDAGDPHGNIDAPFPVCSTPCCDAWSITVQPSAADPGIQAACAAEPQAPCYCALSSKKPGVCAMGAVAGVWRGGAMVPPGKQTHFRCTGG